MLRKNLLAESLPVFCCGEINGSRHVTQPLDVKLHPAQVLTGTNVVSILDVVVCI